MSAGSAKTESDASLPTALASLPAGQEAGLVLRIIDSWPKLESLETHWRALAARCPTTGPFMEWDWLSQWWKVYGQQGALQVLTVEKSGELIGLLPMYTRVERVMRVASVRVARIVGEGGDTTFDYLEPLVDPGHASSALDGLQQLLGDLSRKVDVIVLPEWREESLPNRELKPPRGWQQVRELTSRILKLDLPSSWDAYMESVSRNRRYMIRSTRRKIEAAGGKFFTCTSIDELPSLFEKLGSLHRKRWTEKGEAHGFSSDAYNALHRAMMQRLLTSGLLRLHGLRIHDDIVAMLYCFRHRDTVYHFQGGFDPDHGELRPGFVLYGYAIEQAIGEGARVFDMLAGEHEYKERWASGANPLRSRELARGNLGGRLYSLRFQRLSALKHWLLAVAAAAAAALSIDP